MRLFTDWIDSVADEVIAHHNNIQERLDASPVYTIAELMQITGNLHPDERVAGRTPPRARV